MNKYKEILDYFRSDSTTILDGLDYHIQIAIFIAHLRKHLSN